jgi:hypothetical protein
MLLPIFVGLNNGATLETSTHIATRVGLNSPCDNAYAFHCGAPCGGFTMWQAELYYGKQSDVTCEDCLAWLKK